MFKTSSEVRRKEVVFFVWQHPSETFLQIARVYLQVQLLMKLIPFQIKLQQC